VVLAPADPVRSLDAILAVPGMRDALRRTSAGKIAVSPVVGSLPAVGRGSGLGRLMRVTGSGEVSARGVALRYREFLDCIVIHTTDLPSLDGIRETGLDV
jgi:LPPG:FO 2-phospho-L-lactate transferase